MNKPDITLPIMSNSRFEALSDGVFAIVMTLLVIEIKIPELFNASSAEIRQNQIDLKARLLLFEGAVYRYSTRDRCNQLRCLHTCFR